MLATVLINGVLIASIFAAVYFTFAAMEDEKKTNIIGMFMFIGIALTSALIKEEVIRKKIVFQKTTNGMSSKVLFDLCKMKGGKKIEIKKEKEGDVVICYK